MCIALVVLAFFRDACRFQALSRKHQDCYQNDPSPETKASKATWLCPTSRTRRQHEPPKTSRYDKKFTDQTLATLVAHHIRVQLFCEPEALGTSETFAESGHALSEPDFQIPNQTADVEQKRKEHSAQDHALAQGGRAGFSENRTNHPTTAPGPNHGFPGSASSKRPPPPPLERNVPPVIQDTQSTPPIVPRSSTP